jgi:hypothetical protein
MQPPVLPCKLPLARRHGGTIRVFAHEPAHHGGAWGQGDDAVLVRCLGSRPAGASAPRIVVDRQYRNLYYRAMKTTLDINDSLLASAKALAARQRTSLTRLIEEGLQLRLRSASPARGTAKPKLPVFRGRGGLVATVNPLSNKALLDAAGDDA